MAITINLVNLDNIQIHWLFRFLGSVAKAIDSEHNGS